jgi:hypothetical protein
LNGQHYYLTRRTLPELSISFIMVLVGNLCSVRLGMGIIAIVIYIVAALFPLVLVLSIIVIFSVLFVV